MKTIRVIGDTKCPAMRSGIRDLSVKITDATHLTYLEGTKTCARCGRPDVKVTQKLNPANGRPTSAWQYEDHEVPTVDAGGAA